MYKNRLKIHFFESQLNQLVLFQQQLQQSRLALKQTLTISNLYQQKIHLTKISQKLQSQVIQLQDEIQNVKRASNLAYDQSRIQGDMIFGSLQQKVQDLNQKLFIAEKGVQRAEQIKKQMDLSHAEYKMSNTKNFKKENEAKYIDRYLQAEQKVIKQFKRSIQLMLKINQKKISKYSTGQISQLESNLANKNKLIKYNQIKVNKMFRQTLRKSKSLQKYSQTKQLQLPQNKFKKQPLISILLKSSYIPYQKQRQQALKTLIIQLRIQNQKQALINKYLTHGLELRNREQVCKYLEQKLNNQLSQEQCVMKMQLISQKLNYRIQERLLSIRNKMKCLDYIEGKLNKKKVDLNKIRKVKSLQKQTNQILQQFKVNKNKKIKILLKPSTQKQFASNPKTNDSLTGHFIC